MLKNPTFLCIFIAGLIVLALFRIKYEVSALETTQTRLKNEITHSHEAIHILKAEWSHLNDPNRLQKLCSKYLPYLKPISSAQLITFQDLIKVENSTSHEKDVDAFMTSVIEKEFS